MARPVNPQRREEVLEGAVAFLAEHGLSGLSMRKLASALGVSTNVISYQFGSKEGLVEAALERARSASTEMLAALRAEQPGITVADAVRQTWAWWRERPARFAYPRLNMEAMMTSDPEDLEQSRRPDLIAFWIAYFVAWFLAAGRARDEAEQLSTLLTAAMTGLVMDTICTGNIERVDRSLERLVSLIEPNRPATAQVPVDA
jgi:AcrR family transcriptional regulator